MKRRALSGNGRPGCGRTDKFCAGVERCRPITVGKIHQRAHGTKGVGEGHERPTVQHFAHGTKIGTHLERRDHAIGAYFHKLHPEKARKTWCKQLLERCDVCHSSLVYLKKIVNYQGRRKCGHCSLVLEALMHRPTGVQQRDDARIRGKA